MSNFLEQCLYNPFLFFAKVFFQGSLSSVVKLNDYFSLTLTILFFHARNRRYRCLQQLVVKEP